MQCTVSSNALSRNTALQAGHERPSDSAAQGREAVVPGFWRDSSLQGVLFLCPKGRSWIREHTVCILRGRKDESPGPCMGSSFLLPRSSGSLPLCPYPKQNKSLEVACSDAWLCTLLLGKKLLYSVSPRATTAFFWQTGRSLRTCPSLLPSLSSQGSASSSGTIPGEFGPDSMLIKPPTVLHAWDSFPSYDASVCY